MAYQPNNQLKNNVVSTNVPNPDFRPVQAQPATQVKQPVQNQSGSFQNLKKFMQANQPGQFAGQFGQKVGQGAVNANQATQQASTQFNQAATTATQNVQQAGQNVQNSAATLGATPAPTPASTGTQGNPATGQMPIAPAAAPTQPATAAPAATTPAATTSTSTAQPPQDYDQATAALQAGINAQYTGPQGLQDQTGLNQQAQNALAEGNAAVDPSGRFAQLQQQFGRAGYGMGQTKLDSSLLAGQGDALQALRQQGRQVGANLTTAADAAKQQATQGTVDAAAVRKQSMDIGTSAATNQNTALQKQADEANAAAAAAVGTEATDQQKADSLRSAGFEVSTKRTATNLAGTPMVNIPGLGMMELKEVPKEFFSAAGPTTKASAANIDAAKLARMNTIRKMTGQTEVKGEEAYKANIDRSVNKQGIQERTAAIQAEMQNAGVMDAQPVEGLNIGKDQGTRDLLQHVQSHSNAFAGGAGAFQNNDVSTAMRLTTPAQRAEIAKQIKNPGLAQLVMQGKATGDQMKQYSISQDGKQARNLMHIMAQMASTNATKQSNALKREDIIKTFGKKK